MTTTEPRTRDQHQIAAALGLIKVLDERLKKVRGDLVTEGQQVMRPGERAVGELPDGTLISGVTYTKGSKPKPQVTDEDAFLGWVEAKHPGQIEVIRRVRPAFQQVVLANDGKLVDKSTGEIDEAPGITWSDPGKPHLTVTGEDGADEAVARAVTAGAVNLRELLAIEAAS